MGLFDRITGKSKKSVSENSYDYWELKRILDVENDLDKRCKAATQIIEAGDPRGRFGIGYALDPSNREPYPYLELWIAVMVAIREDSKKRGFTSILEEFGADGNQMPKSMLDTFVKYYDALDASKK
jgi:hypothetical protein